MESKLGLPLLLLLLLITALSAEAYTNYTVGGTTGWYDKSVKSDADYQKWASGKNFTLGDFLIFNTDTNHSVVQTYNLTTYRLCDYEDSVDNDTTQWSSANPSNTATFPVTVAVPLVKEGVNYFFSADYDGDQCRDGQQFQINVTHGKGLPKSLADDQSPGPASAVSGDDDSVPDTIVPSNFNNPHEEPDDDNGDSSSADPMHRRSRGWIQGASYLFLLGSLLHVIIG